MQQLYLILALIISISHNLAGQSASTLIGSRAASVGYASACLYDEWGLFNNVAGIAEINRQSVSTTYDVRPQLVGADRTALIYAAPLKTGALSAGVFQFGDKIYNEHKFSVGYANTMGIASLGLSINYTQYRATGFGTRGALTLSAGGIATLTKSLSVGVHIQNINQPELTEGGERIPTLLAAGLCLKPSTKAQVMAEVQKDLDYDATIKFGIEYTPRQNFSIRTGFNARPQSASFGFRLSRFRLVVDYSFQYVVTALGTSHQATLLYKWKLQ